MKRIGCAGAALLAALAASGAAPRAARAQGTVPSGFTDEQVVGALDMPTGLSFLPDGRLFFVEQKTARIRLVVGGALAATDPVTTVPSVQTAGTEQGLLGIAVDPGWPARPYVYVHYDYSGSATIRITRFTVTGDLAFTGSGALAIDPASAHHILTDIPDVASNHNGGTLRSGPDGMLYASLGEDATQCAAQDTVTLRGKILRLDVDGLSSGAGGPPAKSAVTPADNPFAAHADANARLVWVLGLRNPFRFHADPLTGDLYVADVGANSFEEMDRIPGGGLNMGWPFFEGSMPRSVTCPGTNNSSFVGPIHSYDRSGFTASIIGGGIYRRPSIGTARFPAAYEGDVFFSDYYQGFLRRLEGSGSSWTIAPPVPGQPNGSDWGLGFVSATDYLRGPDGGLWYCRHFAPGFPPQSGSIRRIVYDNSNASVPGPPGAAVRFWAPYPSVGGVLLNFELPRSAFVRLTIHDLRGRVVRDLVAAERGPGPHIEPWDWKDAAGARVPAGVYLARLEVEGVSYLERLAVIR